MNYFNPHDTRMTLDELSMPMTMEEFDDLPEFFKTSGAEMMLEPIEEPGQETINEVYVPDNHTNVAYHASEEPSDDEDELVTEELLLFFEGVSYEDLEDVFRSHEFGNTWRTNPIFSDDFLITCLPRRLLHMVCELHRILHIQMIVGNIRDMRYSSLSKPQQTQLRELVHASQTKYRQLDDLYNRLKGFISRTESYQVKFLLKKTIAVVQDVLCKNIEE